MKAIKQMCGNCHCYHCDSFVPIEIKPQQLSLFPTTQQYFTPSKNREQKINQTIIKINNASKVIQSLKNPELSFESTRPNSNHLQSTTQSKRLQPSVNNSSEKPSGLPPHPKQITKQIRSRSTYQEPRVGNITTIISKIKIQPSPIINKQYVQTLMNDFRKSNDFTENPNQISSIKRGVQIPKINTSLMSSTKNQTKHQTKNNILSFQSQHNPQIKQRSNSISLKQSKGSKKSQKALQLTQKLSQSFQVPNKFDVNKKTKLKIDHCSLKDNRCLGVDLLVDKRQQIIFDDAGHIYQILHK